MRGGVFRDKVATLFFNLIDMAKKVSRNPLQLADINKLFDLLWRINSLGEYEVSYLGRPLDLWEIPHYLEDFIAPSSVRISNSDALYVDILDRDFYKSESDGDSDNVLSYDNFRDICIKISALFKVGETFPTNIATIRQPILLNDVMDRAMYGGLVHGVSENVFPVPVKDLGFIVNTKSIYQVDVEDALKSFIYKKKFAELRSLS